MVHESIILMLNENIIYYMIPIASLLGVLVRVVTIILYCRYIRAANEMGTSNVKWIKQMKLRYEAMHRLDIGIKDTDIFIRHHMAEGRGAKMLLGTCRQAAGITFYVPVILGSFGGVMNYLAGRSIEDTILYFFTGAWCIVLLIIADIFTDTERRKDRLTAAIKDYFINLLQSGLEQEKLQSIYKQKEEPDIVHNIGDTVRVAETYSACTGDEQLLKEEKDRQLSQSKEGKRALEKLNKQADKVSRGVRRRQAAAARKLRAKRSKEARRAIHTAAVQAKLNKKSKAVRDKETAKQLIMESHKVKRKSEKSEKNEEIAGKYIEEGQLIEDVLKEFLV